MGWEWNHDCGDAIHHGWLFITGDWKWGAVLSWHMEHIRLSESFCNFSGYMWVATVWTWVVDQWEARTVASLTEANEDNIAWYCNHGYVHHGVFEFGDEGQANDARMTEICNKWHPQLGLQWHMEAEQNHWQHQWQPGDGHHQWHQPYDAQHQWHHQWQPADAQHDAQHQWHQPHDAQQQWQPGDGQQQWNGWWDPDDQSGV